MNRINARDRSVNDDRVKRQSGVGSFTPPERSGLLHAGNKLKKWYW